MENGPPVRRSLGEVGDKSKISNLARRLTDKNFWPFKRTINFLTVDPSATLLGDNVLKPTATSLGAFTITFLMLLFLSLKLSSFTIVWTSGSSGISMFGGENPKNISHYTIKALRDIIEPR